MTTLKALIPLDGSEFSEAVLPSVCRLLDPDKYVLTLLRVAPVPEGVPVRPPRPVVADGWSRLMYDSAHDIELTRHPVYTTELWESTKAELVGQLGPAMGTLKEAGFKVSAVVRFGDPAQEIADFVEAEDVDLVVMATHGRSGLPRVVMGSVAEKVLRSLQAPVMMLRPLGKAATEEMPLTVLAER